ncbi:hypothetical protein [Microbulbifer sp. PSTR4-B]|uniref:hypothetical protein n=1 Tax=unclassified Microbulbifer TaxID=2619833 RepID=UPI00403B096D
MKTLAIALILIFSVSAHAEGYFQILDESRYPEYSQAAMRAVVADLKKSGKNLEKLYAEVECTERFCDVTISLLETFGSRESVRGCMNYCVHFGFNNVEGYIVKKAHIR